MDSENGEARRVNDLSKLKSLIENVANGSVKTEAALSELGFGISRDQLEMVDDSVLSECLNKESCGYTSEDSFSVCPKCGCKAESILIESKPESEDEYVRSIVPEVVIPVGHRYPVNVMYLAYLRPQDKFIFTYRIPKGLEKGREYTIIPADRGFVAFSDNRSGVNKMQLSYALLFEVKLLSDIISAPRHERKCHVGDQVRHTTSGREGMVVEDGSLCNVEFTDDGPPIYEQIPQQYLTVVRKTQTTRSYIQFGESEYYVKIAGSCSEKFSSLKESLVFLYSNNRLAFNRYSKYLLDKSPTFDADPFYVTEECRLLLQDIDPLWRKNTSPSKKHYVNRRDGVDSARN